ncbi:MAG: DUF2071 domain-containing protein, partial [Chthoniobacterales bacterium]
RGTSQEARFVWQPHGPAQTAAPGTLEFFLLERYHLYSLRRGKLLRGTVAHAPYEFRAARVEKLSLIPTALAGFSDLGSSPRHVCYSDGVDVSILGLESVA